MRTISGGCLCGAIRYRAETEPVMVAVCHCTTCQKNSGSAFSTNIALPVEAVEFTGDTPASYEERASADSPPFYRAFCSRCGSPVSGRGDAYPGIIFVKAGTLDDPSWVSPSVHIWCTEKQPWVTLDHSTPQLPAGPGS
ncbi:MAG: GFA family protein [Sedimenticolaceae bacterium]